LIQAKNEKAALTTQSNDANAQRQLAESALADAETRAAACDVKLGDLQAKQSKEEL
jgi:hypothetical protein